MKYTALNLIKEIESLFTKWNDEIIIDIEGENYNFGINIGSIYTEVFKDKIYLDIADVDALSDDDVIILNTFDELRDYFKNKCRQAHISTEQLKFLPIYFSGSELNGDPEISVLGWKSIKKRGNQIIITISNELLN